MGVTCKDITCFMEELAPQKLAEDWDNVGLLVGNYKKQVKKIMVCLDATLNVVEDAINQNADLIICHHPVIFKGLKSITEDEAKGNLIYKLIKNGLAVYCAHTNLDIADGGVNDCLANVLELSNIKNLKTDKTERLYKIVVFVPEESVDKVRDSMSMAGAGYIGNYSDCSFMVKGTGTFKPLENTNPYIGTRGNLEKVAEYRLETVTTSKDLKRVIEFMINSHPYEEVAYDVYALDSPAKEYGMGKIGTLNRPMSLDAFAAYVKHKLCVEELRVVGDEEKIIEKVAVFSGSFDERLLQIAAEKSDAIVTGDVKYHTALEAAEKGICIIDAGHFATEKVVLPRLINLIKERFEGIDVVLSTVEKNPFKNY